MISQSSLALDPAPGNGARPEDNQRDPVPSPLFAHTADIVCAYVSANHVPTDQLPSLITAVFGSLQTLSLSSVETLPLSDKAEKQKSAVRVKDSVTPDHIISLETGKPYRSLKRHLSERGMTPEQYRLKWKLPDDYPMVAASYSERRRAVAHKMGLGQRKPKAAKWS